MGKHISVSNYRSDPYYTRIVTVTREILRTRDFVAPIEVFLALGLLARESVDGWRNGRIPYLEKVILCNLGKASRILRILRLHTHDLNMEPKLGVYSRRKTGALRFSKTVEPALEEAYRRHFFIVGDPEQFRRKHVLLTEPSDPVNELQA